MKEKGLNTLIVLVAALIVLTSVLILNNFRNYIPPVITDCNYYCNHSNFLVQRCESGQIDITGTGTYPNCTCSGRCIPTTTSTIQSPCTEGTRRCLGNSIEQCINGNWAVFTNFCPYGCTDGECNASPTTSTTQIIVGGPCSYDKFAGSCVITSINQTADSLAQADYQGGYAGYEVKFRFIPAESFNTSALGKVAEQSILNNQWNLQLMNSWFPGPRFLAKYNITQNSAFSCKINLENQGSCTPIIFTFDTVNTTDYFEMQS